ncbi:MAG TPA: heterodisulfide reductase-related iron-sulfur binding cluster, partial [Anaerolineae bacterium]|nr:heterodisulfide reductase-related iron-sulfur binding cluster [Anaerolineae bacterium]
AIFDAHLLLLEDPALVDATHAAVAAGRLPAARAWAAAVDRAAAAWDALEDPYQRARAADVRDVGHAPFFEELAAKTAAVFRQRGVTRLVALSPHSYDVFKNHYPPVSEGFAPQHYVQFLAELLATGRLKPQRPLEVTLAFHDPCYLARHNAEIAAPRQVLDALPGVTRVELAHSGLETLCCGGGGGRMYLETAAGERFSDVRVEEARAVGVQLLATACPYCIVCLEDSVKARKLPLLVKDVAEIVALTL